MLQMKVEEQTNRITVGDVNNLGSFLNSKRSHFGGSQMTSESQKQAILSLQYEIEKNMNEIGLLK